MEGDLEEERDEDQMLSDSTRFERKEAHDPFRQSL